MTEHNEFDELYESIKEPLNDEDPQEISRQCAYAQSWAGRLLKVANTYEQQVNENQSKVYPPAIAADGTKMTVGEREAVANRMLAPMIARLNEAKGLLEIVNDRVSLGQSMMKQHRTMVEGGIWTPRVQSQ